MRNEYERFRKANTEVLGISVDGVETLGKYRESLELPFPLLADDVKSVTRSYGVLVQRGEQAYAQRSLFLVDREGKLSYVDPSFNLKPESFESLYRALEELKGEESPKR